MAIALHGCSVCGSRFEVKFSFQVQTTERGVRYYCSQACHEQELFAQRRKSCNQCGKSFELRYAFQQMTSRSQVVHLCSTLCRDNYLRARDQESRKTQVRKTKGGPVHIAVLNQKGGTGKTTTAVNLAAGLAEADFRTLLIDLDAQGHVATSLGAEARRGVYQLFVENKAPHLCTTPLRENLDAIIADERLANVEMWLARMGQGREKVLRQRMLALENPYDFIILDCGPALSLLNLNALTFAQKVLVPVSCDFLSLVGVKQMLRTLDRVNRTLSTTPVQILGILPTFYDRRNKISDEAVKTLKGYFRDKVLPPIRINTKLKEAPRHKQTIFEYAPESNGARDYSRLIEWVIDTCDMRTDAAVG